ncbi:hypothetical protein [Bacteroides caecimuris]|uniref:hypothetical protein n=1 Tax=Bacteroides caecimuris TaxID=1796613 RepID=UPI002573F8C1|nr:hypothetical protein [Bacteroides caecimuris]
MDDKLLVAIVAASAALLGGIIQKGFDLISNWQKTKHERFKDLRNIQKEVYWEFILAMQKFMNDKTNENFSKFQDSVNKVLLYGDNETSNIINAYFRELIKEANRQQSQSLDHKKYQTQIINAMRKHLEMDELENFELISFTPK